MQKRKKRRVKGDPRLSFFDDIENGSDEDDFEKRMVLLTYLWSYYYLFSYPIYVHFSSRSVHFGVALHTSLSIALTKFFLWLLFLYYPLVWAGCSL